MAKALDGIRIVDLSRVLAGPYCTQILGDLGAEIIKIERPASAHEKGGDDTRGWGPPFLKNTKDEDTSESAYYLSCNRNKKSIAIDIKTPEGQSLIKKLLEKSDVVIHNFKVGGLEKYGLGYDTLKNEFPALVYCAISGFGQNGPLAHEPGYDFLAQGMAGLMASTGEPNGQPVKAGVALSDIMTGLNAAIGILAALNYRTKSGKGQMVDVALNDCTLAAMTNLAQYYLTCGETAPRLGNAHSTIVPYQTFEAADGHIILAVGNDGQFSRLCNVLNHSEWAKDEKFSRNQARVKNRDILVPMLAECIKQHPVIHWLRVFEEANVPCGPVNTIEQSFAMEQTKARAMHIEMNHPLSAQPISLVGSPLKLSQTPVSYDLPPPICGAHTDEILQNLLDLSPKNITQLKDKQIIGRD